MDKQCPVCNADCVVEDLGDHPDFLSGICDECNAEFAWSKYGEAWIYIDTKKCTGKYAGIVINK